MDETPAQRLEALRRELERDQAHAFELFEQWFWEYWSRSQLRQADELLTGAKELPFARSPAALWLRYFEGLLANEHHRRWDRGERIFSELLLEEDLPPSLKGRALMALALTCDYLGRWPEAIKPLQEAADLYQELGDRVNLARALTNCGIIYTRGYMYGCEGFGPAQLSEAESCHRRALAIARSAKASHLEGQAWNNLGAVHKELGRWREALHCYRRHLAISRRAGNLPGVGRAANNIGEGYQHLGQWKRAEASYRQALQVMQEHGDRYEEADILANLASLLRQRGRLEEASATFERSIEAVESLRVNVMALEARADYANTVTQVYGGKVLLSLETGRTGEAFDYVERAKSRAFIEMLANRSSRPTSRVPAELLAEEQDLRARLRAQYQANAPAAETAPLEAQLEATRRRIHLIDAEYASFTTVAPLTHQQVRQRLPHDAVLLEYYVTPAAALVFVVTRDSVQARVLAISPADLEQKAFDNSRHLRRLLPDAQGRLHDPWILSRLHDSLIAPVWDRIRGKRRLYLIPHGVLHYVPFHALSYRGADGGRRYLVQDLTITYAPSATVLLEYCQSKTNSPHSSCLVLGHGRDLALAEAEARAIAALTGTRPYLGEQARREVVYQEAGRHRYLHFSCHGVFNARFPLNSGLVLADGLLDAGEVLDRLQLEADLVTLSACETGLSRITRGDELVGLARAFIYAGTPSVLVSLWKVDELSTRLLMEHLYRDLVSVAAGSPSLGIAEALRRAQLYLMQLTSEDLRSRLAEYGEEPAAIDRRLEHLASVYGIAQGDRPFAHPYFWAPFVLIGEHTEAGAGRSLSLASVA